MQMTAPAPYTPTSDAMDRHDYGVSKNRKAASTGGGRAWSEDEVCLTGIVRAAAAAAIAHLERATVVSWQRQGLGRITVVARLLHNG